MALSCSRASHVSWLSGRARGGLCHVYGSIGYQVIIATPVQVLVRATRDVATPKPAFTSRIRAGSSPGCSIRSVAVERACGPFRPWRSAREPVRCGRASAEVRKGRGEQAVPHR